MKKVSVVIPTYNQGRYICETIDSVLGQTFQDFEVIVVDDGSTDDTRQKIERYLPRISYIYQENAGCGAARNTSILASKGEYVAFLDSDDLWLPDKLRLQVEFMDSNPQFGMVFSDFCMFREDQITVCSFFQEKKFVDSGDIFGNLIRECFIRPSTILVRREVFQKVGLHDTSLLVSADYDLWLRIAKRYPIAAMSMCLVKYRVHDANLSKAEAIMYSDIIKILKKHYAVGYPDRGVVKQYIRRRLAESHFSRGYVSLDQRDNKSARSDFLQSVRYGSMNAKTPFFLLLTLVSSDVTDKIRQLRREFLIRFRTLRKKQTTANVLHS